MIYDSAISSLEHDIFVLKRDTPKARERLAELYEAKEQIALETLDACRWLRETYGSTQARALPETDEPRRCRGCEKLLVGKEVALCKSCRAERCSERR